MEGRIWLLYIHITRILLVIALQTSFIESLIKIRNIKLSYMMLKNVTCNNLPS